MAPLPSLASFRPSTHEVTLLADGMPLNFIGLGGMSDRVGDVILTEIIVACALVAAGEYACQCAVSCATLQRDSRFGIGGRFFEFQAGGLKNTLFLTPRPLGGRLHY